MAATQSTWEMLTAAAQEAKPLLPMYLHLILSALFPIYTGAFASLSRPSSAAKPDRKKKKRGKTVDPEDDDDDEEEDVVQKMEGLSPQDAIIFPITAGIVLAGLYFLIKRYGAELINLILGWYFSGVGVYSVARLLNDGTNILLSFVLPNYFASHGKLWRVRWSEKQIVQMDDQSKETASGSAETDLPRSWIVRPQNKSIWSIASAVKQKYATKAYIHDTLDFKANLTLVNFLSVLSGIAAISYANLVAKPWFLTNLQGFAVCYSALQFMSPTSFTTGSLILGGLFCYDIWAVFFTPLMVTVAKNLDQPIKLVFPRPDEPSEVPGEPPIKSFSMLGLGDIVLPGLLIALALRFDLYMFYLKQQKKTTKNGADGKAEETIKKAPFIPVTGNYGERFWTSRLPADVLPAKLTFSFPKPYFTASLVGYIIGMLTTLGVMSIFQHAQPALLYLVPGVLISLWGTGLVRGEVKHMWEFSEAITGEQLEEVGEEKAEGKEAEKKEEELSWWEKILYGRETKTDAAKDKNEAEKSSKHRDTGEKEAKATNASGDGVIVAFSITRYTSRSTAEAEEEPTKSAVHHDDTEGSAAYSNKASTTASESDDAVLVEADGS